MNKIILLGTIKTEQPLYIDSPIAMWKNDIVDGIIGSDIINQYDWLIDIENKIHLVYKN